MKERIKELLIIVLILLGAAGFISLLAYVGDSEKQGRKADFYDCMYNNPRIDGFDPVQYCWDKTQP